MDPVLLSRIHFAITVGFHYIFPPLTIGLSWFVVWALAKYIRSQDEAFFKIAQLLSSVFTISFAIGVATGITMEFQFGMNWAEYAKFVGDIFGTPLAAEIVFAFFLESIFVGILAYGWKRFKLSTLLFAATMTALGATLSAFWILVANSWMQTPAGFSLKDGHLILTNFSEAIFNPSLLPRLLHTLTAAVATGSFFAAGIGAYYAIKGMHTDIAGRLIKAGLLVSFIAFLALLAFGHYHAIQVAHTQPEKLAAIEGVFETQSNAPLLVFGIPDVKNGTMRAALRLRGLLSLLAFGKTSAVVTGLNDVPRENWPPLALTFYPFHLMVLLGTYFIVLSGCGIWLHWQGKLLNNRLFLKLIFFSIPLPFVANELGWITAEAGRQPWAIYHLIKTRDAISANVPAEYVLFSIVTFSTLYLLLFALWAHLIKKRITKL